MAGKWGDSPSPFNTAGGSRQSMFDFLKDPNNLHPLYTTDTGLGQERYGALQRALAQLQPTDTDYDYYKNALETAMSQQGRINDYPLGKEIQKVREAFNAIGGSAAQYQHLLNDAQITSLINGAGYVDIVPPGHGTLRYRLPGGLDVRNQSDLANDIVQNFSLSRPNYEGMTRTLEDYYRNPNYGIIPGSMKGANRDIFREGWQAQRLANELFSGAGMAESGARETSLKKVNTGSAKRSADYRADLETEAAGNIYDFKDAAAGQEADYAALEDKIKGGRLEDLFSGSAADEARASAAELSSGISDRLNAAKKDLAAKAKEDAYKEKLASTFGGGAGAFVGSLLPF